MSQKRQLSDMDDRMINLEDALNIIKSRLSSMEERLMDLERQLYLKQKEERDNLDLSQVPIDPDRLDR